MDLLGFKEKIVCEKCLKEQEDLAEDYILHDSFGYSPQKHDCWNCGAVFFATRKCGAVEISFRP